jgi:hypothetical protein
VCEGETEEIYLKLLRRGLGGKASGVDILTSTEGPNPTCVVESAERLSSNRHLGVGDDVFCVFDRDIPVDFTTALQRINALNNRGPDSPRFHATVSVPCWEFWALLHFERTAAPENSCDPVIAKLLGHLPGYRKAHQPSAATLLTHVARAVDAAKWLVQQGQAVGNNPSTNVHELVEHLRAMAGAGA